MCTLILSKIQMCLDQRQRVNEWICELTNDLSFESQKILIPNKTGKDYASQFLKLFDVKYFCTDKYTTHCTVSKKIVKH